ncbi:MAG: type II toxin-antitoxin system PemK/MazF family toxin [archaeon]|jgi:mRNA interferase MazF
MQNKKEQQNKDFDKWNEEKKEINLKKVSYNFFFYEREVWWSSLGVNVGIETDGKNENFERPVLIIKKFNGNMVWVLPLTSKEHKGFYYQKINYDSGVSWAHLSQIRTISTKRLLRKVGTISETEFIKVINKLIDYIKIETPTFL